MLTLLSHGRRRKKVSARESCNWKFVKACHCRKCGRFSIKLLEASPEQSGFVRRRLQISRKNEAKEIVHYQFVNWPNYGVPDDPGEVADLVNHVYANNVK